MENYEQYKAKIEKAIRETQEHFKEYFENLDNEDLKDLNNYVHPYEKDGVVGYRRTEYWEKLPKHIRNFFTLKIQA